MSKKIYEGAGIAVGSANVPVEITTDLDLATGVYLVSELEMIFIKPSGETFTRTPSSISGYIATYNTVAGDIDEEGEWHAYLKNLRLDYEFVKGNTSFSARPKALDMGLYNG